MFHVKQEPENVEPDPLDPAGELTKMELDRLYGRRSQAEQDFADSLTTVGERGILHIPAERLHRIIRGDYPGREIILESNGNRFKFTGYHTLYNAYQVEREP